MEEDRSEGSAICIDSPCDFFEPVNLKGDLGVFGDFGLSGDLSNSWSSTATNVSGSGVLFLAIVRSPRVCRVAAAADLKTPLCLVLLPKLCHSQR
jgi:hypothetical protein